MMSIRRAKNILPTSISIYLTLNASPNFLATYKLPYKTANISKRITDFPVYAKMQHRILKVNDFSFSDSDPPSDILHMHQYSTDAFLIINPSLN